MTPSELKYRVEQSGNEPHFFTRSTMKFFGDTMSNYGVRLAFVVSEYDWDGNYVKDGIRLQVWELWRKHAVKHGIDSSAYFDPFTFRRVHATTR
jgi:hypothetical protein